MSTAETNSPPADAPALNAPVEGTQPHAILTYVANYGSIIGMLIMIAIFSIAAPTHLSHAHEFPQYSERRR